MSIVLSPEVLQDDMAVSIARVMAAANARARELEVDVLQSLISLTQHFESEDWVWRVNYGPKDFVGRRGGDLIVDVNPSDARVERILWGQ
jgi:hypothetical protein